MTAISTTCPAVRKTNRSPNPQSKISSGGDPQIGAAQHDGEWLLSLARPPSGGWHFYVDGWAYPLQSAGCPPASVGVRSQNSYLISFAVLNSPKVVIPVTGIVFFSTHSNPKCSYMATLERVAVYPVDGKLLRICHFEHRSYQLRGGNQCFRPTARVGFLS